MEIKNVEFITSFSDAAKYAEHDFGSEVCVVGRSNVGKSTFINTLVRRKIAKTSATAGRTRLINIFKVNGGEFTLVDLPGYGYAQASKKEKLGWQSLAEGYFSHSRNLRRVFVLVDIRHEPSELDKMMLDYLYYYRLPFTVLAAKCDKLSRAQCSRAVMTIAASLKIGKDNIICVSQNGTGRQEVLKVIESALSVEEIVDTYEEE